MNANSIFRRLDWVTTLIPFICILALCGLFMAFPEASGRVVSGIRFFLGDELGVYYMLMGLAALICSLYMAFSRFGNIRLGDLKKPQYPFFQWGAMLFTAGLAADILFYSLCEWLLYADEDRIQALGSVQDWASSYPLFHWGPIPWSFYMSMAVAFGFMIHVRRRSKQKYSEACRPLLGKRVDGLWGRVIDLLAVFALLAGTATTFSLATPLLSMAISRVTGLPETTVLTISILAVICLVYTLAVYFGMKGVSRLASSCVYLFFLLLAYVLFSGGQARYTIETGLSSLGILAQNFIGLSTWTDPLRTTSFVQNWTIFYWAYWMVWCIATPFFIGTISKGRTIRQTVLGGYFFGLAGTFTSFIILGNYGLGLQMTGRLDLIGIYRQTQDLYQAIMSLFSTLPMPQLALIILVLTMIAFYATSFDALAIVASSYSYKSLEADEEPDKRVKLFWSIVLMLLPVALIFSESSMSNLQSVSIIAAFPIGFVMILIVASFFKDAGHYLDHECRAPKD